MNLQRLRLEDRIAQAERDLAEVGEQVVAGELDAETADGLRATYRNELEALRAAMVDLADASEDAAPAGRSRRRVLAGAVILVMGAAALTFGVVNSTEPRGGAEGIVAAALSGDGRDLSNVTNEEMEAVVAANPDVIGMRLALARRYFEIGDLSAALRHYLQVIERQPHPEALANLGWITFLGSDEFAVAEAYELKAIEIAPEWTPAYWYLANIRFQALGDEPGAAEALAQLLARDGVPEDIRTAAEEMLAMIEAGS